MYNFETYVFWLFLAVFFISSRGCINFPKGHIPPIRNPYFDLQEEDESSSLRRSERLKGKKVDYKD
jgi:hypothetical protein